MTEWTNPESDALRPEKKLTTSHFSNAQNRITVTITIIKPTKKPKQNQKDPTVILSTIFTRFNCLTPYATTNPPE